MFSAVEITSFLAGVGSAVGGGKDSFLLEKIIEFLKDSIIYKGAYLVILIDS